MPFGNEEESEEMKETVLHVAAANFTTSHSSSTKQMQFAYFEIFETAIFFEECLIFFGPKINQNVAI